MATPFEHDCVLICFAPEVRRSDARKRPVLERYVEETW